MSAGRIEQGTDARAFMLAGSARVTLVSTKTGARFTFRISRGKGENAPHFVGLLAGSSNETDFQYLGTIFTTKRVAIGGNAFGRVYGRCDLAVPEYVHGQKSRISKGAPSALAFAWAWRHLAKGELPPGCEVWHEGKCGRCGRALTVPSSIASGIGPDCAGKMGRAA